MKWVSRFRDKVVSPQAETTILGNGEPFANGSYSNLRNESELEFRRLWEEFRAPSSEMERDEALAMAVDIFCKLARQVEDSTHIVKLLVDARVFSFVVAKALVTEIEKLKKLSSTGCLDVEKILHLFMESSKDERNIGANMLYALEILVSPPFNVQPLLDAGLLPCLVWVLHTLLQKLVNGKDDKLFLDPFSEHAYKLMVEGCMVHIIKALAQHPGAAQSLTDDDSLQLLFDVAVKPNIQSAKDSDSRKFSFSCVHLHQQALQILGLLLSTDNGSSAQYIHRHQLMQVLVKYIQEFDNRVQDAEIGVAIVDVLRECIDLSYRPQSLVRLRDDLRETQGYQCLLQFALKIAETSSIPEDDRVGESEKFAHAVDNSTISLSTEEKGKDSKGTLPHVLTQLLDILVEFSQVGTLKAQSFIMGVKIMGSESSAAGTHSSNLGIDGRHMDGKVNDTDAVQVLQDIFLKANNVQLQSEVLDRLLHIFSSNVENYGLCQRLHTLPLLIQNMPTFPEILQKRLLKILEYAVIVVNYIPEQELLSLCCLFQQPQPATLCRSILLFFTKVLSFDKEYNKILREAGALDVLTEDLKKLDTSSMLDSQSLKSRGRMSINKDLAKERILRSLSFHSNTGISSCKAQLFGEESTLAIAWDCLVAMLKGSEGNQMAFRRENGVSLILPLLAQSCHRGGVIRSLNCLICEDINQSHSEEFSALIEMAKNGTANLIGQQIKVDMETKRDILWAIFRILSVNNACTDVFGATNGFDLLSTVLHSFQEGLDFSLNTPLDVVRKNKSCHMDVFEALINVVKAAVSGNAVNRGRLHKVISSQAFKEVLCDTGLFSLEHEELVVDLLLSLAVEKKGPPGELLILCHQSGSSHSELDCTAKSGDCTVASINALETERSTADWSHPVLNAGAIMVVLSCLKCFSNQLQLKVLRVIMMLAEGSTQNQESITASGCVSLLLEIADTMDGDMPMLEHILNIVEILGSYRLSAPELRTLAKWVWLGRDASKKEFGQKALHSIKRLIQRQNMASENSFLVPFMEMSPGRNGYACMAISLGERAWPPPAGYSFSCWIRYKGLLKKKHNVSDVSSISKKPHAKNRAGASEREYAKIRIFSVGSAEEKSQVYADLYMDDSGSLVLATGNSNIMAFNGVYLEEGVWHHIVVVQNKPNALTGLFQSSAACLYVNGRLRQAGKLAYSASPVRKTLQATIGAHPTELEILPVHWSLGSCYLFEEVLPAPSVFLMYALGRSYRGLFQDADLLRFIPYEACGGDNLATFEALEVELALGTSNQKVETTRRRNPSRTEGSGVVWDLDRLAIFAAQLASKKLVFCFDGTSIDATGSGSQAVVNLVDPLSAATSPSGGIPRIARLYGDISIYQPFSISESISKIGGVVVILALIEAAASKEMLHVAISLLTSALHWSPHNVQDMSVSKGYHLLALFLRRHMCLFDMQDLDMLFKIAVCEASSVNISDIDSSINSMTLSSSTLSDNVKNPLLSIVSGDAVSSIESQIDATDYFQQEIMSHVSDVEAIDLPTELSKSLLLFNSEMMEYVLLDWTLWVAAPVTVQVALLGFIESLVSMHRYRNHNLTMLRRVNIIQHLLVTLQRGDVEIPILEKLVVLLGILLEDGFLASELKSVVDFVVMTFEPPEIRQRSAIPREPMGMQVIVRNMLLEMLIDLQVTISSEDILERWHKIVSSKLITFLLDEAVHPTSMRWVMTLLGVCLSSSTTFATKFSSSGGFQGLVQVLPIFFDCPEVYYIVFCLIFGKPVYPRQPEVRMLDFLALMPDNGSSQELVFTDLLEAIIAMSKAAFDRVTLQLQLADEMGDQMQINFSIDEKFRGLVDTTEELQGEALLHKTYAARFLSGEVAAPEVVTSILRYMVDLAKMCQHFSSALRRQEILDSCTDLYFSAIRSAYVIQCSKHEEVRELSNCMNLDDAMGSNIASSDSTSKQLVSHSSRQVQEVRCLTEKDTVMSITRSISGSKESNNIPNLEDDTIHSEDVVCALNIFPLDSVDHLVVLAAVSSPADKEEDVETNIPSPTVEIEYNGSPFVLSPNSTFSEASRMLTANKHVDSMSISPFDRSLSRIRRSTYSETNVGTASLASLSTRSTCSTSFHSDIYYKLTATDAASATEEEIPEKNILKIKPEFLLKLDSLGSGGGPCSAAAVSVLDLVAEVLADGLCNQVKAVTLVEAVLEAAPLFIAADSVLCFQGLCLSRLVGFFERRLLRDEEEVNKRLDKAKWSANLEAFSVLLVDRVYMGAFAEPGSVLKVLEFLLSMLQLANKDRKLEATVSGKGFLSRNKGGARQVESYVLGLFKSMNRMIMYCFTPSFLTAVGEEEFISSCLAGTEISRPDNGDGIFLSCNVDICTVLQLVIAHRQLIFCAVNMDTDLICCLCVNSITMLWDTRPSVRTHAVEIMRCLIAFRSPALEELLIVRPSQGEPLDILHGGLDRLLSKDLAQFYVWFRNSREIISKVLEQCASIMWMKYVASSAKLPGVWMNFGESRRKREMSRRLRKISKVEDHHWNQMNERRYALDVVRDAMSTELRVLRQDKYGWVLHAESEWEVHVQHLAHECGALPMLKVTSKEELDWELCTTEGPYRMRKKFVRCKVKIDLFFTNKPQLLLESAQDDKLNTALNDVKWDVMDPDYDSFFHLFSVGNTNQNMPSYSTNDLLEGLEDEEEDNKGKEDSSTSSSVLLSSSQKLDRSNSVFSAQTSNVGDFSVSCQSSPRQEDLDKDVPDDGEYLIRPFLEPGEKVRYRYNCERVVGLEKKDGLFLIGEMCLYIIENFYINDTGHICEKVSEDEMSVIDQALGVKYNSTAASFQELKPSSSWKETSSEWLGARAWAYSGGAWGREKSRSVSHMVHPWHMWKLDSIHELLKRRYQLRPVAIELFSMDGCNDLLVFHKNERDEVFKNLIAMNLPRNIMLDTTISVAAKQENGEGGRLFKMMAKSFSKRWQNGEISNFQYLMHLNTLAGRGYNDLTQYPVFPWVLADYDSEHLNLDDPKSFRRLDKPMGALTAEREEDFRKRYDSWDDPEIPSFHYGSHYSSAGIVLFYLIRVPPFSMESKKLQGGQFDHADRLFSSIKDTWLSASHTNTADVKELIPEFFYLPEMLENPFDLDFGCKQSGDKVSEVTLPPWANGSAMEFIRKHREALESQYVSENLHHWIDLIFGFRQQGQAAVDATNVFFYLTYEGAVDIDSISDPAMKASILAQINNFGQTPRQLFQKPHPQRRLRQKPPLMNVLRQHNLLFPQEVRTLTFPISHIAVFHEKILAVKVNQILKPPSFSKYVAWGFPDRSLRIFSYDQDKLISTHEGLHGSGQLKCVDVSKDGRILVTGGEDGVVSVWRFRIHGARKQQDLQLQRPLCAHSGKITCLAVCQAYSLIVSGSEDGTVILWDLSSLEYVRRLPLLPAAASAVHANEKTGNIITASGTNFSVWSINGVCLATRNTSQVPSDTIISITSSCFSDWMETNWFLTGHRGGSVKLWRMEHNSVKDINGMYNRNQSSLDASDNDKCNEETYELAYEQHGGKEIPSKDLEYQLMLVKELKWHKQSVTCVHLTNDLKQLFTGDSGGHLISWMLPDELVKLASLQDKDDRL